MPIALVLTNVTHPKVAKCTVTQQTTTYNKRRVSPRSHCTTASQSSHYIEQIKVNNSDLILIKLL